ncbi:hypothetical protein ABPG74_001683 [Tetrahymena malaccensis]
MGCCCGKKPIQRKQVDPPVEQKQPQRYEVQEQVRQPPQQPDEQKREEVEEEEIKFVVQEKRKEEPVAVKAAPPIPKDTYTLADVDQIPGANKLNEKEKLNVFRAMLILDSKGYKILQITTVISFGVVINAESKEGRVACMKIIFHDEQLLPTNGNEEEQKRILQKELEVIQRAHDSAVKDTKGYGKRVLKYKSHFIDNGKSIENTNLKNKSNDLILFVEQEDSVNSTLQEFINQNCGKLNSRSFLLIAQDLIWGMQHLHNQKLVNRTLNPDKILVSSDGKTFKYCDFRDINLADNNQQIKNLTKTKLEKDIQLQSPQIQHILKNNPNNLYTNAPTDIWIMGASLAQLSDVDQRQFNQFSAPENNKAFVGDDEQTKAKLQKEALFQAITALQASYSNKSSAKSSYNPSDSKLKNQFPGSSKVNEDCNELLSEILEIDEQERLMHKISSRMDYLALKYHLNAIQPRHLPDYIKGKQIKTSTDKQDIQKLEQQVAANPSNAQDHAKLASCIFQYDKDNINKGIEHINKAIQLDPNNSDYYNIQGCLYEKALMIDEAEKSFKIAIEKDPSSSLAYHNLGYMNQKIYQNNDEAIKYYQKAVEKNTRAESSLFNIAVAYKDQKKFPEAKQQYEKLLKINPNDSQVYNNLGFLYVENPQLRQSEQDKETDPETLFKKALDINSKDICALVNLAQAQLQKDAGFEMHQDEIIKNLAFAEKISPKHAYIYYVKGLMEMIKSEPNWQNALDNFNKALQFNPAFSLAAYQIGLIQYEVQTLNKPLSESIQYYEKAIILDRNNYYAYYSLAIGIEDQIKVTHSQAEINKLRAKCLINYQKAIQVKPDYIEALNNIAVFIKTVSLQENKLKKNSKEYEIAEYFLKQAEALAPNHKIIIDNLEKLYNEVQQEDLAQQKAIKSILAGEE